MNNSQGALYFGAGIDTSQFRRDIESMRRDILGLNNTVRSETRQMDSSFKNLSIGIAGYFSASALLGFTQQLINVRGEFQKTEIAFSTMLGDGGKATELMSQMVDLAAKTPFSLSEVANGAKQLLAFQIPANEVVDTLTRMGNIAAGLSVPLSRINLVYGQVKAKGKLMGDDLRQFTEAGIPMVAELAKKFGKTTAEITAMVSAGKIGFKDVQDVLFSLTNEGGMFYNLMEKQSKSLSGQIANLGDSWDQMLNKIGQANEGILSDGIAGLNYLVDNYEECAKVLGTLIEIYGAYRVALAVTAALQGNIATPAIIQGFTNLMKIIRGLTVEQTALNAASMANPYVLLATGIAAVVAITYNYRKELGQLLGITKELTASQKAQQAVNEELSSKFSSSVAKQKTDIQGLIGIIRNEASTIKQREDAYRKLIAISPAFEGTLDNQFKATNKLGSAFAYVVRNIEQFALAQAQIAVKTKALTELTEQRFSAGNLKINVDDLVSERNKQEAIINKLLADSKKRTGRQEDAFKLPEFQEANKKLSSLRGKIAETGKAWDEANNKANATASTYLGISKQVNVSVDNTRKGISVLEAQLKGGKVNGVDIDSAKRKQLEITLKDQRKLLAQQLGAQDPIDATPEISLNTEKVKSDTAKHNKQLAEVFSTGSIADLEQRISLWNEALTKASGDKIEVLAKDKFGETVKTGKSISITDALKEVDALEKAKAKRQKEIQLLSFDEELSELERRIKIRDQIIQSGYSKEVADSMFPDLAGKDLLKSLQDMQANINVKMSSGKGTKADAENYTKLSATIDALLGKQSLLDKFNKETELALSKLTTAGEQIIYLKDLQSKMDGDEYTNGSFASTEENIRRILGAEQKSYQDLLIEHQSYEDKRNEIAKQATDKRISILNDPKLNPEQKSQLTTSVSNQSNQQISDIALDELENSSAWQMLYQNIDSLTAYQIDKLIMSLEENKDVLAAKMTPIDLRNVTSKLRQTKQQLIEQNPFQGLVTSFKLAIKGFGAETEEETQIAQKNFEDVAEAVKGTFQKIGDVAGSLEPFKDVLGEAGADALQAIMSFSMSAITIALLTKTTLSTIKAAIKKGEWSSVILAILQIVMLAIKAVISLISWLWKMGDKKKEKQIKSWAKEVENLKNEYNALKDAIDRALGEDVYKNQTQIIANLREQQRILTDMRNKEQDKKKTDDGKVNEYNGQISDIDRQINEIYDNISQSIAQTNAKDLASSLADALIEAYGKGESAAEAYGKVADDVMKNAVKNALKMQLLEGPMQNVIKQLIKNMGFAENGTGSFDGLTTDERDQIKNMISSASNNYMQALGAYSDLFGEAATNSKSLEGAIKGVTEETAGVLAGQMNAIRIMQGEALTVNRESQNVLRNQLLQLTQIEINTRYLKGIYMVLNSQKTIDLRSSGLV